MKKFNIFHNCEVALASHICFPSRLVFYQHLNLHIAEVESSRTPLASRTDFEVLGLETSSPRKLACPRVEDSTIFWLVKSLSSAWKIFWKTFFCGDRLKNFCEDLFFFGEHLRLCPWPRAFLSLASRVSVLGKAVLGLGLGFFLCPWPWPRALCPRPHLWHIAYPGSPTEPSNHTREQFLHLPSYPLLRLLRSKSDNKVTRKRILDQYHTGTPLSSTALR